MPPATAFIDANLLVLLVVGSVDRTLVARHRRTRNFVADDFDRLCRLIDALDRVLVTPNTLTEASNLLNRSGDIRLMQRLEVLVRDAEELHVASRIAVGNPNFVQLGLADAVLLESISAARPLVTVDFDLYGAALAKGGNCACNFTHWQTW